VLKLADLQTRDDEAPERQNPRVHFFSGNATPQNDRGGSPEHLWADDLIYHILWLGSSFDVPPPSSRADFGRSRSLGGSFSISSMIPSATVLAMPSFAHDCTPCTRPISSIDLEWSKLNFQLIPNATLQLKTANTDREDRDDDLQADV
jgi:hypothetical protein